MKIFTWRQRLIVLATNAVFLAFFCGGGYLLDGFFGTSPILMIVGLLVSFFVGQYILAKLLKRDYHRQASGT